MTEEKKSREEITQGLNKALQNWEFIFNSLNTPAMLLNSKFQILKANDAMLAFLDKDVNEVIGKVCYQIVHSKNRPIDLCPLEKSKETKKREEIELYIPEKQMTVLITVDPCLDGEGNLVQMIHLVRDITALKKTESMLTDSEKTRLLNDLQNTYQKLKEAQFQLIQAEKMSALGVLASGVAHEVKNPLSIIIQAANYLDDVLPSDREDAIKVLAMIKEAVDRANNIVHGLIDYARISALNLKPEDINIILGNALNLARCQKEFENIEVADERSNDLPKVLVDKNKIQQVFLNILTNACLAMPKGGKITLRTFVTELADLQARVGRRALDYFSLGEKVVKIEFIDTGFGMSEEVLAKVFDPFFSSRGPRSGAGLGLSICSTIINLHKGLIDIESKEDKGTRITVTLKAVKGE